MSKRTTVASKTKKISNIKSAPKKVSTKKDIENIVVPETPEKKHEKDGGPDFIPESAEKKITPGSAKQPTRTGKTTLRQPAFGKSKSSPAKLKDQKSHTETDSEAESDSESDSEGTDQSDTLKKPTLSSMEDAKSYIDGLYQTVGMDDKIVETKDNSRIYIFSKLDPMLWPVLPMGYKWFYKNSNRSTLPEIKMHSESKEKNFEITIFGPNAQSNDKKKVNYVTWFDNLNVQCYANCRPPKSLYSDTPRYPNELKTTDFKPYDRGHGIDYADTILQDAKANRSSVHLKNFIPEPSFWNRVLRRTWVGQIRKNAGAHVRAYQGAYMQRVYYHDCSLYHKKPNLNSTINDTPIPVGAYFSEINSDRDLFLKTVDIPWDYNFDGMPEPRNGETYLDTALLLFSVASMPTVLVYATDLTCQALDKMMEKYARILPLKPPPTADNRKKAAFNRMNFEQLYQAAESEYLTPHYKLEFSMKCADAKLDTDAKLYLKRAERHAERLSQLDIDYRLSTSLFNLFKQYNQKKPGIFTDAQKDFWKKLTK